MAINYLDPNFWQTALRPVTSGGLQFQPMQQQAQAVDPNMVALPPINAGAPRFNFNPNVFQETTYSPAMRLNMFLDSLKQVNDLNKTGDKTGFYSSYFVQPPDQGPNNVVPNNNVPVPRSVASYLPPPPPPPAPASNNLLNNLQQQFITVGGKRVPNPIAGAFLPGYQLSYAGRK